MLYSCNNLILCVLCSIFLNLNLYSQLLVKQGTSVLVNNGTEVLFTNADDSLILEENTVFENNGLIILPSSFSVIEPNGFPIIGSGSERLLFISDSTLIVQPGNLGFSFQTINSGANLQIERRHLPYIFQNGFNSVSRTFSLQDLSLSNSYIHRIKFHADTTEYMYNNEIMWNLFEYDTTNYALFGNDSSNKINCFYSDTLSFNSTYSLAPTIFITNIFIDSVCQGDDLHVNYTLQGVVDDSTLWYFELSDENGQFPGTLPINSTYSNDTLNYNFNSSILPNSGSYTLKIYSNQPLMNHFSYLFVRSLPNVQIIGLDSVYCINSQNDSILGTPTLATISGQGYSFPFFEPSAVGTGTYYLEISYTDPFGCYAIDSVLTTVQGLPPTPLISNHFDTLFCQGFPSGTIQWYYLGVPISNDSVIITQGNGLYLVEYIDSNGCSSNEVYDFQSTGTNDLFTENHIRIYPNPSNGYLFIENNTEKEENIRIYDLQGRCLETITLEPLQKIQKSFGLSSGIYFFVSEKQTFKMIIE